MATVFKQIFTAIILELFYPNWSWLNELTNLDHMVSNNMINLSEAGIEPEVVQDNNTWPLTPVQRTDTGIQLPLATFDTKPTHVTNVEELETAYDKCRSVANQHINVLRKKTSVSAAYNIAPASNTATTPVLKTTGADRGDGTKALTYRDITNLSVAFNEADLPEDGRILLMNPRHQADLKNEDMKLYKIMMTDRSIDGFKIYMWTGNPKYDVSTGQKMPYGSATGNVCSIAFVNTEAMRCMGDVKGEPENRWADYRGWLLGFQLRFLAMPFRQFGIAAIYSDNV